MTRSLAGDVQHAIGAHAQWVHCIPSIAQQQVGKDKRRRMCLDIVSWRLTICGGANGDDFIIASGKKTRQNNKSKTTKLLSKYVAAAEEQQQWEDLWLAMTQYYEIDV